MRKLWMALVTVAALTIGAVFAEGVNNGTAGKSCGADKSCSCCAKSCEK